jgi:nicotinamidase-related amidase
MSELCLHLRSQALVQDGGGHNGWETRMIEKTIPAAQAAIVICDMWDSHWSRGARERVDAMAPRMNRVIGAARARGVQIIHAPSDTMSFYAGMPARERMQRAPRVVPPAPLEHPDQALPIDDSDGGSDTGEAPWYKAWTRQHPVIAIDQERDGISDDGVQVFSFLRQQGSTQVLIMGVHTNMCVLRRSFAIKAMVRWGVDVALVRDLTDTMYNPAQAPYVSHDEGTRLVVAYIEKFWCPTLLSDDLL